MVNKKIIMGIVLSCTLAVSTGCSEKASQNYLSSSEHIKQEINDDSTTNQDDKQENGIMDEFNTIIERDARLDEIISFVNKNISFLSKENGSIMVNKLEELQKKNLKKLENKFYGSDTLQNKMYKIYSSDLGIKIENVDDNELKALLQETMDNGYKVESAEGMFFPIIDYEFYKKYSSYITPDIKDYIHIMEIESNEAPAKDAALVIEWGEVLKRALRQEKFINGYPDSGKINDVKELYKKYIRFTLFGLNNTPLFSYDSKVMVEDARGIYNKAIESNEGSKLIITLKDFIEILEKNNYRLTDKSKKYREDVLESIFETDIEAITSLN
ncbi:hypothetical protein [Wukongibacter sp. M2B1]|uniref:hypothetical protein n=1 Tax=Wukongibacter sp. M2B1 TaxID=3088895 RepID=UPI003D7A9B24